MMCLNFRLVFWKIYLAVGYGTDSPGCFDLICVFKFEVCAER